MVEVVSRFMSVSDLVPTAVESMVQPIVGKRFGTTANMPVEKADTHELQWSASWKTVDRKAGTTARAEVTVRKAITCVYMYVPSCWRKTRQTTRVADTRHYKSAYCAIMISGKHVKWYYNTEEEDAISVHDAFPATDGIMPLYPVGQKTAPFFFFSFTNSVNPRSVFIIFDIQIPEWISHPRIFHVFL